MCSSNTAQFINRILSDNNGCNSGRCRSCGNTSNCGNNCGCSNGNNSCGCDSCGCESVGGSSSNDCSCGCEDYDNNSCDCAQAITNRLLYELLNELRAIRDCLCGCNG